MGKSRMPSLLDRLDGGALRLKLTPGLFSAPVSPDWSIEARFFSDHDFFYCLEGEAEFTRGEETVLLTPGVACLIQTGQTLSARHTGKGHFRVFAQHFDLSLWGREDLLSLLDLSFTAPLPHRAVYEASMERMAGMAKKGGRDDRNPSNPTAAAGGGDHSVGQDDRKSSNPTAAAGGGEHPVGQEALRHALFLPLILDYLGAAWRADRAVSPETRILQAVEETLRSGLEREDVLARALAKATWDPPYTSRLFARNYGSTPKQYLIRLRLARARELLEAGTPVKEVARACGFADELYFSRLFHKKEGRPPTAHRSLW
jgi:AraC-like DNA-binding protein